MTQEVIMTPEFRADWVHLLKPYLSADDAKDPNKKAKYQVTMLFKKGEDLTRLKNAVVKVLTDKFGDKTKWPKNLRLPFRDQADKEKEGKLPAGYESGAIFTRASSLNKPGLIDTANNDIIDSSEIYPGCYMKATVHAYYYNRKGNQGVTFDLHNVQKQRDGEPLSGRLKAQDEFEPVAGAVVEQAAGDGGAMDLLG